MAFAVLPLMLAAGFSIDFARQVTLKKRLESAVDAATLSGAKHFAKNQAFGRSVTVAHRTFAINAANFDEDTRCRIKRTAANYVDNSFQIRAECSIPTMFGISITGKDRLKVSSRALARGAHTSLDLALIMDNSGTMHGAPLATLQTAAGILVNQLVTPDGSVRISLIPYQETVNPGAYGFDVLGFETTDPDSIVDRERDGRNLFCLTERLGEEAFTDAEPGVDAYLGAPNSLTDGCDTTEFMPLTSNVEDLIDRIELMTAPTGAGTAGHMGIAWGWYTISPNWSDVWPEESAPLEYGNPDHLKVMVIMTDGTFNYWNWLIPGGSGAAVSGPDQARNLCAAMKAEGIIIFTIAFDATPEAEGLMRECATTEDAHYFEADDTDALQDAFLSIGRRFKGTALAE